MQGTAIGAKVSLLVLRRAKMNRADGGGGGLNGPEPAANAGKIILKPQ